MYQANHENEEFKQDIENLRHMMIHYPNNINYICLKREIEQQVLGAAMVLARNFSMTNFLNSNLSDQIKAPRNMYRFNIGVL